MIKHIFKFTLLCVMLLLVVSCDKTQEESAVAYLEVNYASLNGTWRLSDWNGQEWTEKDGETYVYITFNRKEHTFEMYDNVGSMYSHHTTGSFTLTEDDDYGMLLSGIYDYSDVEWGDYIITEMTENTMKWSRKDNLDDVSVYTRVSAIPDDIVKGVRMIR